MGYRANGRERSNTANSYLVNAIGKACLTHDGGEGVGDERRECRGGERGRRQMWIVDGNDKGAVDVFGVSSVNISGVVSGACVKVWRIRECEVDHLRFFCENSSFLSDPWPRSMIWKKIGPHFV